MRAGPPRVVTLVLCLPDGTLLGALPPFEVEVPWWQEAGPVVEAARCAHGVDITVLRLLAAPDEGACGGPVTYLAEVAAPVAGLGPYAAPQPAHGLESCEGPESCEGSVMDHPLRLAYARPSGPAADLAWADATLAALGRPRTARARQVRTWNLSSLWRLPTGDGAAWLKVVPPFFAHEGSVLSRLDPSVRPPLLATDGLRILLEEVPGTDLYGATGPVLVRMVTLLVGLQVQWCDRVPELLSLGAADWRAERLTELAGATIDRASAQLDADTLRTCCRFVDDLPARFAEIATCGLPDTLVHGDFHPGNLIGDGEHLTLLDWGDCGVGNPLLDRAAFVASVPLDERAAVLARWDGLWRGAVPGSDPARAAELVEPVSALRQAVVYDAFLQAIEPSERVYHAGDPARWLRLLAERLTSRARR